MAGSGTNVSAEVLSALPVELPPRLLEILLVTALASALAFCALPLLVEELPDDSAEYAVTPLTVADGAWVCAEPEALPAAVLKRIRSSI